MRRDINGRPYFLSRDVTPSYRSSFAEKQAVRSDWNGIILGGLLVLLAFTFLFGM